GRSHVAPQGCADSGAQMGRPVKMTRRAPSMRMASVAAVLAAAIGAPLAAQQVFRGGTDVVLLTITVLDSGNRLVAGLDQEDFQIYEDGVKQDPSNFSRQAQ